MIPGQPYREDKALGAPLPAGLVNALQRDITLTKGTGTGGTFPGAPAWGGGYAAFAKCLAGIAPAAAWTVDSAVDWRDRYVFAFGVGYDAANKLPGEGSEPNDQPGAVGQYVCAGEELAATAPTSVPVFGYLHYDAVNPKRVLLHNGGGGNYIRIRVSATGALEVLNGLAATVYLALWVMASDQFPARL